MRYSICVLLFISSCSLNAQSIFGVVVDANSKKPLPYVNIGVPNQRLGTVSDINGAFSIDLKEAMEHDSICFSMIGYKNGCYLFTENTKDSLRISLEETAVQLQEMVVKPKTYTRIILGNKTESKAMAGGFASNNLGSEVGIVIKPKDSPTFLEKFNFFIVKNEYDSLFFRLNLYALEDGEPSENLLQKNIFITTIVKEGKVSIDLTPYNLVIYDDALISLEWVRDFGDTDGVYFSVGMLNGGMWAKHTSLDGWEKVKGVGLGFNVEVIY